MEALRAENAALRAQLADLRRRLATDTAAHTEVPGAARTAHDGAAPQPRLAEHGLSKAQVERYSRQLLLPAFGVAGQAKVCAGSVLIVGCGGLGSPAVLYLAAAGVGKLGLVDHDAVELSNMHRQIAHTEARVGQHKAESAAAAVAALNSGVQLELHAGGLTPGNAVAIVSAYDVVLDASDNPPTRYLVSDACVACGVPLVSAAAVGTDGQLTVYNAGADCPCYRCLFPECPAPANCQRCADAGVLGPVPGVMGVLQALEAIKLLSGCGQPLAARLLIYDALAARFTTIRLRGRSPACAACGPQRSISREGIAAYDYAAFTGQQANDGPPAPLTVLPREQRLAPRQLQAQLAQAGEPPLLLDVRPAEQFAVLALPGAVNVPFSQLEAQLPRVLQLCGVQRQAKQAQAQQEQQQAQQGIASPQPAGTTGAARRVFVVCRRGNHSQLAVQRLWQAGVSQAVDLVGGLEAWAADVDPAMPVL